MFDDEHDFIQKVNFDGMQNLQDVEETAQTVLSILKGNLKVIEALETFNRDLFDAKLYDESTRHANHMTLQTLRTRITGYQESASGLLDRIKSLTRLVRELHLH
jgi:hypothetical protein